jgi:hypothetical protein
MKKQSSIVIGLVLILAGLLFLLLQAFPEVAARFDLAGQWPLIMVGIGALFLIGAIVGSPPLAVPGSIVGGIGLLLYFQNATGNWDTWAYAWTLIPGFVGIGIMLMGLLDGSQREQIGHGFRLLLISLALFLLFGGFFGAFGQYWPILLILAGVFILFRSRFQDKAKDTASEPLDKSS